MDRNPLHARPSRDGSAVSAVLDAEPRSARKGRRPVSLNPQERLDRLPFPKGLGKALVAVRNRLQSRFEASGFDVERSLEHPAGCTLGAAFEIHGRLDLREASTGRRLTVGQVFRFWTSDGSIGRSTLTVELAAATDDGQGKLLSCLEFETSAHQPGLADLLEREQDPNAAKMLRAGFQSAGLLDATSPLWATLDAFADQTQP